jgi:DNA-binding CsgD family transcriptional regulator
MLVGRDRECARLDRLVEELRGGQAGVVVLRGEAGIGKSALLNRAAESCDGVVTALRCRGIESESELAFSALLDLLRPVLDQVADLPAAQRAALEGALALAPPHPGDRFTTYVATLSLLGAASERAPVLCIVDDVHWLDAASAEALAFVARRLQAEAVAFVFAARDDRAGAFDGSHFEQVELAGLDRASCRALLERVGTGLSDEATDRLFAATAGNPLALIELPAALEDGRVLSDPHANVLPATTVELAFAARTRELPLPTRTALLVAAVADSGDMRLVARALAAAGVADTALEPAEAAGIAAISDGALEFRHPLMRSAVYHDADPAARRAAHRAYAEGLVEERHADARAWHLAAAATEPDEAAAIALERSADGALARRGYGSAAPTLERAARLTPDEDDRARRLLRAAECYRVLGHGAAALTLAAEAVELTGDPGRQAEARRVSGRIAARSGSPREAHAIFLEAAELVAADPEAAAALLVEAVDPCIRGGDPEEACRIGDRAFELAAPGGSPVALYARLAQAAGGIFTGDAAAQSAGMVNEVAEAADRSPGVAEDAQLRAYLGLVLAFAEEHERAEAVLGSLITQARQASAPGILPYPLIASAWVDRATGRWAQATATLSEAIGITQETGDVNDRCWAISVLGWIEAAQGAAQACQAHAEEQLQLHEQLGLPYQAMTAHAAQGLLALGSAAPLEAIEPLQQALALKREHGYGDATTVPFVAPDLIEALLHADREQEAREELAAFHEVAGRSGRASARAAALRCEGMLAPDDRIDTVFDDAFQVQAQAGWDAFATARLHLACGARLRRAGRRRDARDQLQQALERFQALGAVPWAERVGRELQASGHTLHQGYAVGEELTPQELQVAMIVGRGATNVEAGAQLFVSAKTIEAHLTHIYRKLGVRGRTELAHRLAQDPQLAGPAAEAVS